MTPTTPPEENVVSNYYEGYQELELQAAQNQVRKARNALFVVAGLTLVVNLISLNSSNSLSGLPLIFALLISAIFAGLAFLTKVQPFTAIIIALVVFVGLWVLDIAVISVEYIWRGILFRGIIIYFLITGLKHAREAERLKRELKGRN